MSAIAAVECKAAGEAALTTSPPRVISLFSGAGGLDIGLEKAAWRVLAQVEMDRSCVDTLKRRKIDEGLPRAVVYPKRVEDVSPATLRAKSGLEKGELELLAGGPPCQPFTTHGRRRALLDQRAESAFPTYLQYVEEFEPQALLMENVDGLLSAALQHRPLKTRGKEAPALVEEEMKGSFLRWLVGELVELGYAVSWGVAEAADFGVPQMRQRAILIGVKGTEPCYMPAPMHGPEGTHPYRTVREALAEVRGPSPVQPLSERKTAVYAHIPAGGNWRDLPPKMQKETGRVAGGVASPGTPPHRQSSGCPTTPQLPSFTPMRSAASQWRSARHFRASRRAQSSAGSRAVSTSRSVTLSRLDLAKRLGSASARSSTVSGRRSLRGLTGVRRRPIGASGRTGGLGRRLGDHASTCTSASARITSGL
jgi:DNA-cytosine methyltransferase